MRIPEFWAKGTYDESGSPIFEAWGWSNQSLDDARQQATQRAQRIFQHFMVLGGSSHDLERYPYMVNPPREEIVERPDDSIIITRNSYGALILNTDKVMFADIDFPEQKGGGLLGGLFGRKKKQQPDPEQETLENVKSWADANNHAVRIYRTFAGLRLLLTDQQYDPTSSVVESMLEAVGSDPLYRRLTSAQESFRARLTPKPWRLKMRNPPNQYPWNDQAQEQKYRQWQKSYTDKSQQFATCYLVETIGNDSSDPIINHVIELHDEHTLNGTSPLA